MLHLKLHLYHLIQYNSIHFPFISLFFNFYSFYLLFTWILHCLALFSWPVEVHRLQVGPSASGSHAIRVQHGHHQPGQVQVLGLAGQELQDLRLKAID